MGALGGSCLALPLANGSFELGHCRLTVRSKALVASECFVLKKIRITYDFNHTQKMRNHVVTTSFFSSHITLGPVRVLWRAF